MIWTKKEGDEDSFETTDVRGQVTLLKKRPYGTETARVEVTISKEGFETHTQVWNINPMIQLCVVEPLSLVNCHWAFQVGSTSQSS